MRKDIEANLRILLGVAFFVFFMFILDDSGTESLGKAIGFFLGALALAVFDVWILKSYKKTESISKEKVWDFFLYMSIFIIATGVVLKLVGLEPFDLLFGVFFGFILYYVFIPKIPDPISMLRKEIWRRVFPRKN